MDNVARHWSNIKNGGTGFKRLQNIDTLILSTNAKGIADPIYVKNNGTLAEYGVTEPEQKRKNYAFYEGYSRLAIDLDKPVYGDNEPAGVGIMFRISDNIELYSANLADTFNMFDSAIINGQTGRRIIVTAKDSLLEKIDSSGLWVKGIDEGKGEANWYTGVVAVRLPLQAVSNVKIDSAFSISGEGMQDGDPVGKIVGGAEKSIVKTSAIKFNGNSYDTLNEILTPGVLLHRQSQRVRYNANYYFGDSLQFRICTSIEDTGKLHFENRNKFDAILVDTSITIKEWFVRLFEWRNGKPVRCIELKGDTRRLGIKEAENGYLKKWCNDVLAIAIENNKDNLIDPKHRRNIEIVLRNIGDDIKIFKTSGKTEQLFPDEKNLMKGIIKGNDYIIKWDKFEEQFLEKDALYFSIGPGKHGYFEIAVRTKGSAQECISEKVVLNGVPVIESIEFTSDHEDDNGCNILRYEPNKYLSNGELINGPEWVKSGKGKPISQTRNTPVKILLSITVPFEGDYAIEGTSPEPYLSFPKMTFHANKGINKIELQASGNLPNFPTKIEDEINWKITHYSTIPQNNLEVNSISNNDIYVTYGKPLATTSGNNKVFITSKQMNLVTFFLENVTDASLAAFYIRNEIERRLINFFRHPIVATSDIWKIWDNEDAYPSPNIPPNNVLGGQCGQMALLLESSLRMVGLDAEYVHLKPSKDYIRISTLLQPDNTFIENKPPHATCMSSSLKSELLFFYFSDYAANPFQVGEGSVFFNNQMYTMFTAGVNGVGNSKKEAARDAMLRLEAGNHDNIGKLQRWLLLYKDGSANACLINGTVDIPNRLENK